MAEGSDPEVYRIGTAALVTACAIIIFLIYVMLQ
jgi:hypothetical protein